MNLSALPEDYRNGKHEEVWKLISFLDYEQLDEKERAIVNDIITETFSRVEFNIRMVFDVLDKHGFEQDNYRPESPLPERFVIGDKENWVEKATWFYSDKSQPQKIPWSLAAFFTWFKIVDFRGDLPDGDLDYLKDPLYMEALDNLEEVYQLTRDIGYGVEPPIGFMFTPDMYHKENVSGDRGPDILMNKKLLIDNYVIDFTDEFELTFVDYLRFNFEWACFPALAWLDEHEREPYHSILREVADKLKPF